jgi:hypothetical protein
VSSKKNKKESEVSEDEAGRVRVKNEKREENPSN